MNDAEEKAFIRSWAIEAGLDPAMTPNDVAITLHNWFDSVPENPRDPLWREVRYLMNLGDGKDDPEVEPATDYDIHERRASALRAVRARGGGLTH